MKAKLIPAALILLLIPGLTIPQKYPTKKILRQIIVTKPCKGDMWSTKDLDKEYRIVWLRKGPMDSWVKIMLYNAAGTSKIKDLDAKTENDTVYTFKARRLLGVPSGHYRIKVQTLDNKVSDESGVFYLRNQAGISVRLGKK